MNILNVYWKIRTYIQRFQYRNSFAYWLYCNLYRKYRGVKLSLPEKDTDFHLEGYPRSGNTFSLNVLRNSLLYHNPQIKMAHHCHAVASVKRSLGFGLPVVILLRNPVDAVTSSYIKFFALRNMQCPAMVNKIMLKNDLLIYSDFYRYIHLVSGIHIIHFNDLINNPYGFVQYIESGVLEVNSQFSKISDIEKGILAAKNKEKSKNPMGSSLPNEVRKKEKKKLQSVLNSFEETDTAMTLYKKLKSRAIDF